MALTHMSYFQEVDLLFDIVVDTNYIVCINVLYLIVFRLDEATRGSRIKNYLCQNGNNDKICFKPVSQTGNGRLHDDDCAVIIGILLLSMWSDAYRQKTRCRGRRRRS